MQMFSPSRSQHASLTASTRVCKADSPSDVHDSPSDARSNNTMVWRHESENLVNSETLKVGNVPSSSWTKLSMSVHVSIQGTTSRAHMCEHVAGKDSAHSSSKLSQQVATIFGASIKSAVVHSCAKLPCTKATHARALFAFNIVSFLWPGRTLVGIALRCLALCCSARRCTVSAPGLMSRLSVLTLNLIIL